MNVRKTIDFKTVDERNIICSERSDTSDFHTDLEMVPSGKTADGTRERQLDLQMLMDMQQKMDDRLAKLERTHNDEVADIRTQMYQIKKQLLQITYQYQ